MKTIDIAKLIVYNIELYQIELCQITKTCPLFLAHKTVEDIRNTSLLVHHRGSTTTISTILCSHFSGLADVAVTAQEVVVLSVSVVAALFAGEAVAVIVMQGVGGKRLTRCLFHRAARQKILRSEFCFSGYPVEICILLVYNLSSNC